MIKIPNLGRKIILLIGDIIIVVASFYAAYVIRIGARYLEPASGKMVLLTILLVLIYLTCFYIFELYSLRLRAKTTKFILSIANGFGLALLFSILTFYIIPYKLGRGIFLISWGITAIIVFCWRLLFSAIFRPLELRRNVLILANGAYLKSIADGLEDSPEFRLTAILSKGELKDLLTAEHTQSASRRLEAFIAKNRINDIVVSLEANNSIDFERALVACRMRGISCYTVEAFYERLFEKLPVLMLNDRWFLLSGGFDKLGSRSYKSLKRIVDFTVAGLVILATLPISLIVILLVKLTSRGPVLFVQERLGQGMKPFKIVKFRTMVRDAETMGPQWAQPDDMRTTKLGKLIRRTRLDEIPQLVNVLKGQMSLIGPRPEREYFVTQLTEKIPFYNMRFFVKPGITGWAQVNFRYGADEADALEKLRYELYYIKNQSFFLDLRILLKTVRVVLMGIGT